MIEGGIRGGLKVTGRNMPGKLPRYWSSTDNINSPYHKKTSK